jgi:3-deoxy-D-manno-octulosonate 8-phosphate phosphatase (KDO 8-P phosphatase)
MNVLALFKQITTFVFDMDGVLTNGTVLVLENGLQARIMNIKDGLALQMALRNGFRVIVVSGGTSMPAAERLKKLGVKDVYMSVEDKKAFIQNYITENQLAWNELLFMGDDLPDLALMNTVGVSTCPADAVQEIKQLSKYISPIKGGDGCVRDIIEKVLKVQDKWIFDASVTSR